MDKGIPGSPKKVPIHFPPRLEEPICCSFVDLNAQSGPITISGTVTANISGDPFYFSCSACNKKNDEDANFCKKCSKNEFRFGMYLTLVIRDWKGVDREITLWEEQVKTLLGVSYTGKDPEEKDFEDARSALVALIGTKVVLVCRLKAQNQDGGWNIQVIKARPEIAITQPPVTTATSKRPKGFVPAKANSSYDAVSDDDGDDEPPVVVPFKHQAAAAKRRSINTTVINDDSDEDDAVDAGKDQDDEPDPEPEAAPRVTSKSMQRKKPSPNTGLKRK